LLIVDYLKTDRTQKLYEHPHNTSIQFFVLKSYFLISKYRVQKSVRNNYHSVFN
jgi:hypothetical protein